MRPDSNNYGSRPKVDYGLQVRPKEDRAPPSTTQTAPSQPAPAPAPSYPQTTTPYVTTEPVGDVSIIKLDPDPPPDPGSGPNTIRFVFQPGTISAQDARLISQTLGLSASEITSKCSFRYSALLSLSNNQGAFVSTGAAASAKYNYTGMLEGLDIAVSSACPKLRRPVSGIIIEQGGYYITSHGMISCPGARSPTGNLTLVFRYTGDGKGECRYQ